MDSLVRLKLDQDTDMTLLGDKLIQCAGCCLEYRSLQNFKDTFSRFGGILYEHADKIKAISSVYEGEVFQSNVYIVSQLEDKFNVPVKNLFISSAFERAIHDLSEFYYQDLCDGSFSIDIMTSDYKNPFNIVEWILTSNISQGTNLSIDMDTIPVIWMTDEIFNSIYSYVNSFVYESYIQIIK